MHRVPRTPEIKAVAWSRLRLVRVVSNAKQQVAVTVELDVPPAVTARQPLQIRK
jgi:hypothetical protein